MASSLDYLFSTGDSWLVAAVILGLWLLVAAVVLGFMAGARRVTDASDVDVEERRARPRKRPTRPIKVLDMATADVLGYVVDINKGGMRMACDRALPKEQHYRLRLDVVSNEVSTRGGLRKATAVWCRDHVGPGGYHLGYHVGLRFG